MINQQGFYSLGDKASEVQLELYSLDIQKSQQELSSLCIQEEIDDFNNLFNNLIKKRTSIYRNSNELHSFRNLDISSKIDKAVLPEENNVKPEDPLNFSVNFHETEEISVAKKINFNSPNAFNVSKELFYAQPIDILKLHNRVGSMTNLCNSFKKAGINTIAELMVLSEKEVSNLSGIGDIAFEKVIGALNSMGLKLKASEDNSITLDKELNELRKNNAVVSNILNPNLNIDFRNTDNVEYTFDTNYTKVEKKDFNKIKIGDNFTQNNKIRLKEAGINTIAQLIQLTEVDILKTPMMGKKSLNEIKRTLLDMGLHLGTKLD